MRNAIAWFVTIALAGCAPVSEPGVSAPSVGAQDKPHYLTLDTPPAQILTPAQALQSFALAPGFTIELAAAEPLIEDPVAVDWDEDGRLYVAEMRAYMPDVEGTGEERPIGQVARLTDVDGDGVFDRREVLLDALVLPRAVRVVNEGLLVAEMGRLWLCPSSTGWAKDVDCAAKRLLGAYGEHQGSVEHAENGLLIGLDNWLYSAKSSRRLKLVDGELVEEPTLFRGQWGITQDDQGRLFYNTNSNLLLGDYFDAQAIVASGSGGAPGLNQRVSPNEEVFSIRVNPGVNRAYLPGVLREDGRLRNATSASGMTVYRGGRFDTDAPDVFVTEPAANVVAAFSLTNDGVAVSSERHLYPSEEWGQRDFLASTDERFRPVDVLNGPDGALYVVDFYRGIIQDHVYLSDELAAQVIDRGLDRPLGMGRIWRIEPSAGSAVPPRPDWRLLDGAQLIDLLGVADIWRRATAQRLLLRNSEPELKIRLRDVVANASQRAAVHALWTLDGRRELDRTVIETGLSRGGLVAEAALLAGGHLVDADRLIGELAQHSPGSRGQFYVVAALRHHNEQADVAAALQQTLVAHLDDAYVRSFVLAALRGQEIAFVKSLVSSRVWSADLESRTGVLAKLSQQALRADGPEAAALLDYVAALAPASAWVQRAVLDGLFQTTREAGFTRAVLDAPHPLFEPTDTDLWPAIAKARRGFTWPGDTLAADAKPLTPRQAELVSAGERFFLSSCANCHGADGAGVASLGPPLAGSEWVIQAPERLARIVLHGLHGPVEVAGRVWDSAMPGHRSYPGFDDEVASGLLTYLRRSWGHAERAIDPSFMTSIREQTADRTALWTVEELQNIEINTHYRMYAGRYGRPSMPMVFAYDGRDLTINAGIFVGPLVETKEDHFLFEPRGIRFEFVLDESGAVTGVAMSTGDGGAMTLPRVPDE